LGPVELLTTLQDALLPAELPVLPGLDVSARYLLAQAHTSAGGDWYDAIPLPDGTVALVVGDVVGHGVAASAVMGQLRAVFEERLRSEGSMTSALTALDRYAALRHEAWATTVCVVVLDPASGEMTYCTAGHPPPLVATTSGSASYLPLTGAGPLVSGVGFPVARHRLGQDDVLVLYSDAIVERPGLTLAENATEFAEAVASAVAAGPGEVAGEVAWDSVADRRQLATERACRAPLERLTTTAGYSDDITLLAAQRTGVPAPLSLSLPAVPESIRHARLSLGEWLAMLRVQPLDEMALQHAVTELVTNAVEHAYPTRPGHQAGTVEVSASLSRDGRVEVAVADQGQWRPPADDSRRGRGLAMTEGFVDAMMLDRDASGTTVRVRHRVSRPALFLTGLDSPGHQRYPSTFAVEPAPGGGLKVSGVVDTTTVDDLRVALLQAAQGGGRRPTIDLSGVTLLCSVGVQALMELKARHPESRLVVAEGSSAQHVLDLVHLEHTVHG